MRKIIFFFFKCKLSLFKTQNYIPVFIAPWNHDGPSELQKKLLKMGAQKINRRVQNQLHGFSIVVFDEKGYSLSVLGPKRSVVGLFHAPRDDHQCRRILWNTSFRSCIGPSKTRDGGDADTWHCSSAWQCSSQHGSKDQWPSLEVQVGDFWPPFLTIGLVPRDFQLSRISCQQNVSKVMMI